ncbi:FecR domain-containing protein [Methylocystis sp. S23]
MRRIAVSFSLLCALSLPAFAEQAIGNAASVERDVQGVADGRSARLSTGDAVYFDEVVTTGAESRAKLAFVDRTTMQMGPSSRVKLDSFVYSGGSGVGFNAARGAFRFVSASGGHKPYEVKTPTATIGVRGTIFAARVLSGGRTDAVLYSGAIEVCDTAGVCRILDKPCTFVTVTGAGITEPRTIGKNDWSFDKACKGAPPPSDPAAPPPGAPVPPPPGGGEPPINWGGPTIGVTLGPTIGDGSFADPVPMNGAAFAGGLKLGYMLPLWVNIVGGFETDFQYRSEIGGSTNSHGTTSGSRPGYIGTARVKLGYAFDRFLVYGTGGFAYGHIVAPKTFSGPNVLGPAYSFGTSVNNPFLPGWTVGAGVSYALTRNISVNAEYLYIKLAHDYPLYNTSAALYSVPVCNISGMHSIRFGANLSFSPADILPAGAAR